MTEVSGNVAGKQTGSNAPQGILLRALRQPTTTVSIIFVLIVVFGSLFAPWVSPYSPQQLDLKQVYAGPSPQHWLGTDGLGRDILTRLLFGGRTSLSGTVTAVFVFLIFGVIGGIVAGSSGRVTETVIMRFVDVVQSIPGLVVLLVIVTVYGRNETAAMITFGVLVSGSLIRVVRSVTLAVREEPYVAVARVAGLSNWQIQRRHILPAITGPVLTQVSLVAGIAIVVEAALGFLGLGELPPSPTWGNMISEAASVINRAPWMLVPTGGIITLMSLALNLLGTGIRDAHLGRSSGSDTGLSWQKLTHTQVVQAVHQESSPAGDALFEVVNLKITLGELTLVQGIDLIIKPGEAVGLVGESGCGKSMTVAAFLRVLPAGATITASRLNFGGQDLLGFNDREMERVRGRGIAYISQEPISSLDPMYSAGDQVAEAIRVHRRLGRKQSKAEAIRLLERVRLPNAYDTARKYPHELSGGMAQRVAIARALAGEPRLLIADEPTTALDVTVQAEILDLLRELRAETGMSLILVTHDWGVLADSCDRAVVMYAGEIVEHAEVRSLVRSPQHPYSLALLRSTPAAGTPGRRLPTIRGSVPPPATWPNSCRFADRCELAEPDCRSMKIPMITPGPGRESRCLHIANLSQSGGVGEELSNGVA
ncbi:dipeptide/oligopeptide/nickel ABC transporter permease/ATP-binding protein [Rhizobium sp. ICMP 5592]|uniref:dipeptide/oligopeptide/nickel ABC transporter permease/ATP-binding protein n=1 Tax=Rhizobium sp. ICMP 5592 TaxID=2292445 RepID=UPI001295C83D|nr:dipeptide/oligopeptide/nickel ABC transporter permease/ATP-binding protein [Rhizobium sp. ICMP 5592]MQB46019.1 ATP-binding cassette domain-containing protein [Rhizobium sp. ICMP 5592]